jgi:hypothetical protein
MQEHFEDESNKGTIIRTHLHIVEISAIAAKTGITSSSNFRVSDMALGTQVSVTMLKSSSNGTDFKKGQFANMEYRACLPFVEWDGLCATYPTISQAVQNICSIDITMLPAGDIR